MYLFKSHSDPVGQVPVRLYLTGEETGHREVAFARKWQGWHDRETQGKSQDSPGRSGSWHQRGDKHGAKTGTLLPELSPSVVLISPQLLS